MISITTDRNGDYIIKIKGIRKSFKTDKICEVHTAINHFFRNHFHDEENCPLCKQPIH